MKTKILLILALVLSLLTVSAQQKTQWEYKIVYNAQERKANELGAEGWELVAVGGSGSGPTSNVTEYVFKRAR